MATSDLKANEIQWFKSRRDQAGWSAGYGRDQNEYDRKIEAKQQSWNRDDLVRHYQQMRQKLPNAFNRRGVMNSGLYQKGLSDWAQDRTRDLQRQTTAATLKDQGFDLARSQINLIEERTKRDIDRQKKALEETVSASLAAAGWR